MNIHTLTGSLVSVAKSTLGKQDGVSQLDWKRRFWEVIHCQALPHQGPPNRLAGSPTHHTYQLTAYQMHPRRHRNLQARHCSTGHRFLHQRYLVTPTTDRRIFYIQSPQPTPDWGISYILSQPPSLPTASVDETNIYTVQANTDSFYTYAASVDSIILGSDSLFLISHLFGIEKISTCIQ